jgi:hypothetical protein
MRILTRSEVRAATSGLEANPQILIRRAGYAVAQFCASQFKFSSVCEFASPVAFFWPRALFIRQSHIIWDNRKTKRRSLC